MGGLESYMFFDINSMKRLHHIQIRALKLQKAPRENKVPKTENKPKIFQYRLPVISNCDEQFCHAYACLVLVPSNLGMFQNHFLDLR